MPRSFARRMRRPATSRTCDTDPGAPVNAGSYSTCTESTTHTSGRSASRVARTASRSVSATIGTPSACGPSRCARSFTWAADSSPETYSTFRPAAARFARAPVVSVDLPMPGAPPMRTSDPGTRPPPRTRSSSPIPVERRSTLGASTCPSATGVSARPAERDGAAPPRPAGAAARFSSVIVFHSPQPGQRPCHFWLSWPQAVHAKTVAERAISARLRAPVDGFAPSVRARFDGQFVSALHAPLAPAEFVALDTETNGYGGDLCEMTEVGAVLVGGG